MLTQESYGESQEGGGGWGGGGEVAVKKSGTETLVRR